MEAVLDVIMNLFQGIDLGKIFDSITGVATNHDLSSILGILADFYGGLFN